MVKLDTFCQKNQLKCSDKTLIKKLSQDLKLSFKKSLCFPFFFFFFIPKLVVCLLKSGKYAQIKFPRKSNKWIQKLDMLPYHITQITIYPLVCQLFLPHLSDQTYTKLNIQKKKTYQLAHGKLNDVYYAPSEYFMYTKSIYVHENQFT